MKKIYILLKSICKRNKEIGVLLQTIFIIFSSLAFATPVHITISSGCKYVMSGNAILSVTGNLVVNGEFSASSTSTIKFCGTSLQQIGGSFGVSAFQNVEFNNPANFKLLGDVTINGTSTLTSGIVSTGTKTLILSETATFSPVAGTATNFIDGKVKKTGNNAAFTFPVGDVQGSTIVWEPLQIAAFNNTNNFTVHFTYKSPYDSLGYNTWSAAYFAPTIHNVSGKEFWLIDRTGAGSQVPNVTLYWKDAVKSDILGNATPNSASTAYDVNALTDLTLVHWNGTKWDDMGGVATGTWPTGQITNSNAFSSYSPITFGSKTGKNPLPIELIDFSATCNNNNNVLLQWSTASETNNSHFSIERSVDASHWEIITTLVGAGNSNQVKYYTFTDVDVSNNGIYYYRLGNIDFNGIIEYAAPVAANCNKEPFSIISIFPNPVINEMHYMICSSEKKEVVASITDVLGQVLLHQNFSIEKGVSYLSFDVSFLNNAMYYFKINTIDGLSMGCKQLVINK